MAADVTIDHSRLRSLLTNSAMVQLLSPLANLQRKKNKQAVKSCRPCGSARNATGATYNDYNTALRELGNLLESNLAIRSELKSRLGASTLRVKYKKQGSTSVFVVKKF